MTMTITEKQELVSLAEIRLQQIEQHLEEMVMWVGGLPYASVPDKLQKLQACTNASHTARDMHDNLYAALVQHNLDTGDNLTAAGGGAKNL